MASIMWLIVPRNESDQSRGGVCSVECMRAQRCRRPHTFRSAPPPPPPRIPPSPPPMTIYCCLHFALQLLLAYNNRCDAPTYNPRVCCPTLRAAVDTAVQRQSRRDGGLHLCARNLVCLYIKQTRGAAGELDRGPPWHDLRQCVSEPEPCLVGHDLFLGCSHGWGARSWCQSCNAPSQRQLCSDRDRWRPDGSARTLNQIVCFLYAVSLRKVRLL